MSWLLARSATTDRAGRPTLSALARGGGAPAARDATASSHAREPARESSSRHSIPLPTDRSRRGSAEDVLTRDGVRTAPRRRARGGCSRACYGATSRRDRRATPREAPVIDRTKLLAVLATVLLGAATARADDAKPADPKKRPPAEKPAEPKPSDKPADPKDAPKPGEPPPEEPKPGEPKPKDGTPPDGKKPGDKPDLPEDPPEAKTPPPTAGVKDEVPPASVVVQDIPGEGGTRWVDVEGETKLGTPPQDAIALASGRKEVATILKYEVPSHAVAIPAYFMGATEVTNAQWKLWLDQIARTTYRTGTSALSNLDEIGSFFAYGNKDQGASEKDEFSWGQVYELNRVALQKEFPKLKEKSDFRYQ